MRLAIVTAALRRRQPNPLPAAGTLTLRADVINFFDKEYEIRNGTGVGVGAPQYGPRRGGFFGLSKSLGPGS